MGTRTDVHGNATQTDEPGSQRSPDDIVVDSLLAASLLAFTGGSLTLFSGSITGMSLPAS